MPNAATSILNRRVLPVGEWIAENAYVAPGLHRFMTAFGLMTGLVLGRHLMDVMTATDRKGNFLEKEEVLPPFQQFHGILAYNHYDDSAAARWHKVVDNFTPIVFGAIGAMMGSSVFVNRFHLVTPRLLKEAQAGAKGLYLQQADFLANMVQSNGYNRLAGANFTLGSTTGSHLIPNPFNTMSSAIRFQLAAGKKVMLPGLFQVTGNRGAQSMNLYQSLADMVSWAENNIAHYGKGDWLTHNQAIIKKAKNALQAFKDITPEQEKEFQTYITQVAQRLEGISERVASEKGGIKGEALLAALKKDTEFSGTLHDAFWGNGLEDQFVKMGLIDVKNPLSSKVLIGDNGIISQFAKLLGGRSQITNIERQWAEAVQQRHGISPALHPISIPNEAVTRSITPQFAALTGITAGGMLMAGFSGTKQVDPDLGQPTMDKLKTLPRHTAAKEFHALQAKQRDHNFIDWINDKPLDTLSWLSNTLIVAPGLHRFMNASCLTAALYGGMKFSTALAGRGLRGELLAEKDIWPIFKPIYNAMPYVWKGNTVQDRWRYTVHQLIPVAVGAVGTYMGSRMFFQNRIDECNKAEYLEDYTDKICMDESESYARAAGVTSILNTGSGFHLLPLASYASNLQNRFMMGQGQQVCLPGVREFWSHNPSKYPYHIKKLLNMMVKYATENPAEYPKEFADIAHAFVGKLYPDLPPQQMQAKEDAFVDAIYSVRDKYWQQGGVPEDRKKDCLADMKAHFTKDGLEKTMVAIGLDPLKAAIDNNGAGGTLARWMGSGSAVQADVRAYHEKATSRLQPPSLPATDTTAPDTKVVASAETLQHETPRIRASNMRLHS